MDPLSRMLVRMAIWVRRPPSRRHMIVVGVVLAVAIVCVLVEKAGWWPAGWAAVKAHRIPHRLL